jgi:hypothetical protein
MLCCIRQCKMCASVCRLAFQVNSHLCVPTQWQQLHRLATSEQRVMRAEMQARISGLLHSSSTAGMLALNISCIETATRHVTFIESI